MFRGYMLSFCSQIFKVLQPQSYFIKMRVILTLLATLVSLTIGNPIGEPEKHKVIIVGAGISGFTAAATLLEHNVTDILVLEADDRIGGRTRTVEFDGVHIEMGAEFIHGEKKNSVYELIKPHNLLTSFMIYIDDKRFILVNTSGHIFNASFINPLVHEGMELIEDDEKQHINGSVADYFYPRFEEFARDKKLDTLITEILEHIVPLAELSDSAAEDLSKMGAYGYTDQLGNDGDQLLKWAPHTRGYKTLFDVISKKFPNPSAELPVQDKILLNKEVTSVEIREGNVAVTSADGSTYLADHVIITVPLGVLKRHAATMFNPPLPPQKTKAIETIGMGCLGKVFLLFPNRWWTENVTVIYPVFSRQELLDFKSTSPDDFWTTNITGFFPVIDHDRILCAWVPAAACFYMDNLSTQQAADSLMRLLDKTVGHMFNITRPEKVLKSEWGSYPYTRGSYSYRSVESDRYNITNSDLAEPILQGDKPVLMFAGEATNRDYPSTVHGALDTGRREALYLINYLNKNV